ncbi:hypothetical protein EKO27_g4069, partial [Xylaria grammica]
MISPFARRLANHPGRSMMARSAPVVISSTCLARRVFQSPSPSFQSPLQTIRMSSTNPANKNFTRDHLFDCKGRVALVTGGGSGIGLMITQALVANGAKVYITGRTSEKLDRVVETYAEGPDSIVA